MAENVKKMLSVQTARNGSLKEILAFTYPRLYTGACWYVGFHAFDPATGGMRRKRIKINAVGSANERKRFGKALCHRLSEKLENGWNPWIEQEHAAGYKRFTDVLSHYRNYLAKLSADGILRSETYTGYLSKCNILEEWNADRHTPLLYIYQFDRGACTRFLDYIYIDRKNSAQTRNNYLNWLSVFSQFLLQYSYVKVKPTEGISSIGRRHIQKERTIIAASDMQRLHDYLITHNKHYLLGCYFLHYVLIRPKEMAGLRLGDINLAKQTVFVADTISKNKKSAIVTLPAKVIELMVELDVFRNPSDYYLFSDGFMPGNSWRDEKQFRDHWSRYVRPALRFPKEYKFYSLKDTGITAMLRAGHDTLSVKEQARHSSLLMTDMYTPQDIKDANPILLNYKGIL
jgi:integrase